MAKVKRTYNLSAQTVRSVRELSERYGLDSTQDGIVELAVGELERRLRDVEEARTWASAHEDPGFEREAADLEAAYRTADAESWPE